jgi:TonB family protein
MKRWGLLRLAIVFVAATLLSGLAHAQIPTTQERMLLQSIQRDPEGLASYLDLARLYADQQRLDEAEKILTRAIGVLQQRRLTPQLSSAASPIPTSGSALKAITRADGTLEPIRVGGSLGTPTKTKDVPPVYPAVAQQARISGSVVIEATIDAHGKVVDAKVLRSIAFLDEAAIDAVRQWEYTPTLLNGVPVPVVMTVTVNFAIR